MNEASPFTRASTASAFARLRHVFVRDLELQAVLGVYDHEKVAPQRVIINLDLTVDEGTEPYEDDLRNVVCYATVVRQVEAIVRRGHVHLVETLAEMIAGACFEDPRVCAARVRIEKPDAIPQARSVGVEIERVRSPR